MPTMGEESGAAPPAPPGTRAALTTDEVRAFIERAPRCKVRIAVLCQPAGAPSVVEAQLVDLSRTGMFLASQHLLAAGTAVQFQFRLDDDVVVLQGTAEVVRLSEAGERGMGLRFVALDDGARALIDRIVEVGSHAPPVPLETQPVAPGARRPIEYDHGSLRIMLTSATAGYFTYNPLLHIGVGGCFIPAEDDVPLGTGYQLDILDADGRRMLRCKGKVAAKQDRRIGVRLIDVERPDLLELRAQIAKLVA
jgi:uncharacterized protein (TIGR02266 family)